MASTRLRKTFQYHDEDSDGDEPLALDEQEQEELIDKLKKENDERNDLYLQIFLIIPSISWILFVLGFIRTTNPSARLLCILGTTSLWATAYNLMLIPTKALQPGTQHRPARIGSYQIPIPDNSSPAQKYVPMLNAALSVLVALWGLRFRNGRGVVGGFWMFCWVPVVEFAMVQMARRWVVEVDPGELERLKYEFRGA